MREISNFFLRITHDEPSLRPLSVSRVKLSSNKSTCSVFFYIEGGKEAFRNLFGTLVLYKPTLRKALAQQIQSRYTPDLVFKYDADFEKQLSIIHKLDKIKAEES